MRRLHDYLIENVWVWVGTGLVLLTLSGWVFTWAVRLSLLGLAIHATLYFLQKEDSQ